MSDKNVKAQNKHIPRGPIEELGAAKQKRLIARKLGEGVAHALDAAAVTMILTMPEADGQTFSTYGYVCWGSLLNLVPLEAREELMLKHLTGTEEQFPQHRAQVEEGIRNARIHRQAEREFYEDLVEQAVEEGDFASAEAHV